MEKLDNIEKLIVKNVNFSFGFKEILKDISFTLEKGKIISIVGPSGGGKTTLLNLCSKLLKLDEGEIKIVLFQALLLFKKQDFFHGKML